MLSLPTNGHRTSIYQNIKLCTQILDKSTTAAGTQAKNGPRVTDETLAERLVRLMEGQNLDATSLAEKAGIQRQRIYDVLHGRTKNPTAEFIDKVADALGIPYKYLLYGEIKGERGTGVADLREDMLDTVMRWAGALNRLEQELPKRPPERGD